MTCHCVHQVWPHTDFPLIDVGRLVLNRNPDNYFAEVEQVQSRAFPAYMPSLGLCSHRGLWLCMCR